MVPTNPSLVFIRVSCIIVRFLFRTILHVSVFLLQPYSMGNISEFSFLWIYSRNVAAPGRASVYSWLSFLWIYSRNVAAAAGRASVYSWLSFLWIYSRNVAAAAGGSISIFLALVHSQQRISRQETSSERHKHYLFNTIKRRP